VIFSRIRHPTSVPGSRGEVNGRSNSEFGFRISNFHAPITCGRDARTTTALRKTFQVRASRPHNPPSPPSLHRTCVRHSHFLICPCCFFTCACFHSLTTVNDSWLSSAHNRGYDASQKCQQKEEPHAPI
jgi:hypothetical protein